MAPCYRPKTTRQDEKFSLHRLPATNPKHPPHRQTTYVENYAKKLSNRRFSYVTVEVGLPQVRQFDPNFDYFESFSDLKLT
jgi:hypothetical protein